RSLHRPDVHSFPHDARPISSEVRRCLTSELMEISGRYPFDPDGRHPLEVIIFLRSDLAEPLYPARSEFIYGEWLRHEYEAGEGRSEEHTSELQSREKLVCRL